MTRHHLRALLGLLLALGLVAAGCTDSDDDEAAVDTGSGSASAPADGDSGDGGGQAAATFRFQPLEPGAVTFTALEQGDIDIALLFSTQGVIAENDWVVLEDDKTLQGSDNIVPLGRDDAIDEAATEVLDGVSAALTTSALTELNRRVDSDKEDPADVARDFLEEEGLLEGGDPSGEGSITVGAANFTESLILANMYALALEAHGFDTSVQAVGTREVMFEALRSGEIQLTPEYVQSLLVFLDAEAGSVQPDEGAEQIRELLPEELVLLDPSEAQDQNALVVTQETAEEYDLEKVSDLLEVEDPLVLGGPPECPERPLCIPGYEEVYGLQFDV